MALDDAMRRNLTFKIYDCRHMIYTHAQAREQLYADVKTFRRLRLQHGDRRTGDVDGGAGGLGARPPLPGG